MAELGQVAGGHCGSDLQTSHSNGTSTRTLGCLALGAAILLRLGGGGWEWWSVTRGEELNWIPFREVKFCGGTGGWAGERG